jgi:hypothetical protein
MFVCDPDDKTALAFQREHLLFPARLHLGEGAASHRDVKH